MIKDLLQHGREFLRYLQNHQYEQTEDGILFPKANARASGMYRDSLGGEFPNLIPTEGLNHMLGVAVNGVTQMPTWYLTLYTSNYTPALGLTAASFATTANENTSATEGYTQTNRVEWVEGVASGGVTSNTASPAAFTFATASNVTIQGAALLSSATRGGTSGVILSATKFSAPRTFYAADTYNLTYELALTST